MNKKINFILLEKLCLKTLLKNIIIYINII
jgi:hypothetical protein